MIALSVVIPAYNAEGHLAACLQGFTEQTADRELYEVIVVDDASPDGTAAAAGRFDVRLVRHPQNLGAAGARNTGVEAAQGDVILFVDSDVVPARGLVEATLAIFSDRSVRAATGRYLPEPANDTPFARYKALWTWHCWEATGAATGESGHLQGALSAVRKPDLLAAGGFDGTYVGGSVEDYELSDRLRAAGVRIVFDDRIAGRHHFPDLRTVARNYWDRTRMWVRLAPQRKGFSSGQANRRSGIAAVAAFGGVAGLLFPPLLPLAIPAQAVWFAASAPFLSLAARREGLGFAVYAAGVHFTLSAVVGAAAVSAPLGQGSRQEPE
ncbi:MAG: glycosyltransferase family 2 protein [Deltaproteobacteria bacterium]|nr:glycosyltransferase family 2 protein [Deltaproteobacteria bacterium]